MKVKEIMVKNVVSVGPEDSLSIGLNRMQENSINQLPVMTGKKYKGMLTLKDVVSRNVDPSQTKCGHLCSNTPTVRSSDDIDSVISTMLNSGLRALPVIDDESLTGIISETDLVRAAGKVYRGLLELPAANIATDTEFVGKSDSVAKVRKIMAYKNVSRVPVIDAGKVIGVVGALDIIKLMEGKKELVSGYGGRTKERGAKEKLNIESTPVENFMHDPSVVDKEARLGEIIDQLSKNEEALIIDNGVKIVTPKDVLEIMASQPKRQVYVQIIGIKDEGPRVSTKIDEEVNSFVQKMGKMIEEIQYVFLHVDKYDKGGKKPLYSIRARFGTPLGMFVAHAEERDPITAVQRVLDDLEREIQHKTGKMKDARKKSRILKKRQ